MINDRDRVGSDVHGSVSQASGDAPPSEVDSGNVIPGEIEAQGPHRRELLFAGFDDWWLTRRLLQPLTSLARRID